jgi:uncharacterized protein DUF5989
MSRPTPSLLADVWQFLRESKKWWLAPIVLALLLIGVLIVIAGSGVGPFLYTIF